MNIIEFLITYSNGIFFRVYLQHKYCGFCNVKKKIIKSYKITMTRLLPHFAIEKFTLRVKGNEHFEFGECLVMSRKKN